MKIKHKWVRIALLVVGIALCIVFAWLFLPKIVRGIGYLIGLFMPFIIAYGFAKLVDPLVCRMQSKLKLPRGVSAVLVIIFIIGIIGGLLTWGIWKLIDEGRAMYMQFPQIYESMRTMVHSLGEKWSALYGELPSNIQTALTNAGEEISNAAAGFINRKSTPMVDYASRFAKALPPIFIAIIVFLLSSYFMIQDSTAISSFARRIFSDKFYKRCELLKAELAKYLGGYLKAQGILMLISFVILFVELSIVKVNYAMFLALLIAFIDALPFFGSGLILWPWALFRFISGEPKMGVWLIVSYLSIMIVRRFAEPKLVSSGMSTNPILTLMSMYIGYKIFSIGGLILGPILMMIIISLYKAHMFDGIIRLIRMFVNFTKEQFFMLKKFFINITRSDTNE